jgi:hypothetical protein
MNQSLRGDITMKRLLTLILAFAMLFTLFNAQSFAEEDAVVALEGTKFVTIQEWIDAKGECGDCMLLLRVKTILNPVLAIAEDETGTVNLFSGNGEDSMIVNFMGDEGLTNGSILVIANPKWNEYEGTVEMADWTVLRMLPAVKEAIEGNLRTYTEMPDGSWECEGYSYQYRFEISGRMPNAAMNSTYVYLSNVPEISFERAYMAAGLSSNSNDYFSPEEAILVEMN